MSWSGEQPAGWSNVSAETALPSSSDQEGDACVPAAGDSTTT